jgi:6-pyruvoyl-tetrahydropterin synthase-like protein
MAGPAGEEAPTLDRQILGLGLIVGTFLFAFVIQSAVFIRADWMLADLAYHRGVAYTMQGAMFQGEGPYAGLISYYGGLYSLGLGLASEVTGRSFDAILSVASWFGTLIIPGAFLLLGRRLWRNDLFAVGFFVALGTLAVPFTTNWEELWVESILPSGASYWPIYPRDIALALACLALWAVTSERRRVRTIGLGLIVGTCGLFHAQMAVLLAWFLILLAGWQAIRARRPDPLVEVAMAGGIALAFTAWWWIPRVQAYAESGVLLIADHASRLPFTAGPKELLIGYGCAGVLAIFGVAVLAIKRPHDSNAWIFVAWILAFLPLVALSRLVPNLDLFTERRLWLVISIAAIGLATCGMVVATRRMPAVVLAAIVLLTVALPSAPSNLASVRRVKNAVTVAWRPGSAGMARQLDVPKWRSAMEELNGLVREQGRAIVVTYDAFGAWAWSFSGAQVISLWTPGPFKLGFDPKALTGQGYLERVRLLQAAFDAGPTGICELAESQGGDAILLRQFRGLVGLYDRSLASPYRLEPATRADAPLSRQIAPGTWYVDDNQRDVIRLEKGATLTIPWKAPEVTKLGLLIAADEAPGRDIATVRAGSTEVPIAGRIRSGLAWEYVDVPTVRNGVTIKALENVQVLELTGFAPWPGQPLVGGGDGPFLVRPAELCGPLSPP